jgi:hypothetical protein
MGAILGIAGGAVGSFGAVMQGKAQAEAARYNRKLTQFQADLAADDTRKAADRTASENVVGIAKSGVRREGSPLEVLANNAYNEERTASLVAAGVSIQSDLLNRQADQALIGSYFQASTSLLGGAAQGFNASSIGSGGGGGGKAGTSSSTTFGTATPHEGRNQNLFPR